MKKVITNVCVITPSSSTTLPVFSMRATSRSYSKVDGKMCS